jgi:chemotaxis family two-component system sensor histidine kinase/response regulator PixL
MITDSSIREQGYIYFLSEARDLLQIVEQEIFTISQEYSITKVHNLMRATHTIKGGAANVGLEVINKIAHSLEDVIKALYSPEVVIDAELQTLLVQAYECLRLPISAELTHSSINNEEVLQRAASVFAQLQEKLGDAMGADNYIPTSAELGFDIVQSIFETGVTQRLESIAQALEDIEDIAELADVLRSHAEVFLGLAESLNLPGFQDIAQTAVTALEANPTCALKIGKLALSDFMQGQLAVLKGDRTRGGEPSKELQEFSTAKSLRKEVTEFYDFLIQLGSSNNEPLQPTNAKFYIKVIRYILGWFNHEAQIPYPELRLSLLLSDSLSNHSIEYIENWLSDFLNFVHEENDSQSLCVYRHGAILKILIAVAQFTNQMFDGDDSVIQALQLLLDDFTKKYKNLPPITPEEKNWCNSPKLQKLLEIKEIPTPSSPQAGESLLETIWGEGIISACNDENETTQIEDETIPGGEDETIQGDVETLHSGVKTLHSGVEHSRVEHSGVKTLHSGVEHSRVEHSGVEHSRVEHSRVEHSRVEHSRVETLHATSLQGLSVNSGMPETTMKVVPGSTKKINKEAEDKEHTAHNSRSNSFIRVDVEGIKHLNYLAGELLIYHKRRSLHDEQLLEITAQLFYQLQRHLNTLTQLRELPLQVQNLTSTPQQNFATVQFDSLEMDEYTEFSVALHSALEETLQLQETTESLDLLLKQSTHIQQKTQRLTLSVIDNLVSARMLPLGSILNRFSQMLEQLGNIYGKIIDLKLIGTEVLVDKAIAEKLYDPLVQIVRNAFDHGIEPPEIRRQSGKPERGLIEICAYHQGSQTIIEVRDDGQGLNLEKIRAKAIELGFISNEDTHRGYISGPSEEEILEFMFAPGFSTAQKLSEISGRGMGLDIVRSVLHSLNGSISVQSLPNQGTTFILKIPFSMTTDKLMLVQAGDIVYALLLNSIEKILLPSAHTIREFDGKKVLHWNTGNDERIVTIRQLSEMMEYNGHYRGNGSLQNQLTTEDTGAMKNPVLLLRRNQELLGLEVDQIIGEQELVIRPLGQTITPPKYVYGCSSLANGTLILVIDGTLLLDSSHEMQATIDVRALSPASSSKNKALPMSVSAMTATALLAPQTSATQTQEHSNSFLEPISKTAKMLLVVDDALSLRQTLSLTLQKFGYQVLQAQHGAEAIEQLHQHPQIELIISDLEMPRMNGFELLSNIRQNPTLVKKPIVILTSRNSEKHRRLALELGASAYVTKPYIEHEFISIIEGLINRVMLDNSHSNGNAYQKQQNNSHP